MTRPRSYRTGVRTFSRSLKYHRRRGLYCLSGDCPNCLMTVDDDPGCAPAPRRRAGAARPARVGFPSTERDLLAVTDRAHRLMPVGFYYKMFSRPRWLWPLAERVIRRHTGVGSLPVRTWAAHEGAGSSCTRTSVVVGGGPAGLAAAKAAAADPTRRVLVVDEGQGGRGGGSGSLRDAIGSLRAELRAMANVDLREDHVAIGVYDGPLVPVVGPDDPWRWSRTRIVATGAVESHGVFPGNDLPGVWLGRGAARMAAPTA